MNPLYYQYGAGPSTQTPDWKTFLALMEQIQKQNGGDDGSGKSKSGGGGGMGGLASLFKMFGGAAGAGPSSGAMAGAAGPMVDSPISGAGGIAGLFA